jgi:predicted lipoprotein with Yx(FWY)xxD motif
MVPITLGQRHRRARRGWSGLLAATAVAAVVGGSFLAPAASARTHAKATKGTKVVKEVNRGTYGKILVTLKKRTLYIQPGGTCTAGCLTIWPPLLMPTGTTMPAGATGLGTVSMSEGLQVTFNGLPLYTFYTDTKKATGGEDVGSPPFFVAQVNG